MRWLAFGVCALLFSCGDYLCSLDGRINRLWTTLLGAVVGALGYGVFSYLFKTTPLAALAGYINGAVVVITCLFFGVLIQGNRLSTGEWFWLAVIFAGICGLAYSRSEALLP